MTQQRITNDTEKIKQAISAPDKAGLNPMNDQPVITVDYEEFAHLIDNPDLSEDQRQEFLQAIWNIIVAFIDFGFDVHPVQLALNASGKLDKNHTEPGLSANTMIGSTDTHLTKEYRKAAK